MGANLFDFQSNIFDVPGAQAVIFTIIDDLGTPRPIALMNRSAYTLTGQYQYSDDGGSTWQDLGVAFDLAPFGSGGEELDVRVITQLGRIRLLASGGASAKELSVGVMRASLSPSATFPIIAI